jgi:hypothetical protein
MILNFTKVLEKGKISEKKMHVIKTLLSLASSVAKEDCSDEDIDNNFKRIMALDKKDMLNKEDYLSERKALKYLNLNRNDFYAIKRRFGIKVTKFNNQPIGYNILDLEKIKTSEIWKRKQKVS